MKHLIFGFLLLEKLLYLKKTDKSLVPIILKQIKQDPVSIFTTVVDVEKNKKESDTIR